MRYQVGILLSETSSRDVNRAVFAKEIKHVVRASSINDAIASLMKAEDLPGADAAYAYPIRSGRNAPNSDDWRWSIRCSVAGKVYMQRGIASLEGK